MKIAVTGGSGQLGTLVLRRLVYDRNIKEIILIDLQPPLVASAKIKFTRADIRDKALDQYLQGCDALIHLAFVVIHYKPRAEFDAINIEGSKNVFQAAVRAGIGQILYTSSIAAYGVVPGHPVPIVESTPRKYQPDMPYAAAKYKIEAFLDDFEASHPEVCITRFRPAILIGRQMDHAFGQTLKRRKILHRGSMRIPIVWDEDVADAILLALRRKQPGAFNLAADSPLDAAGLAKEGGLQLIRLPKGLVVALAYLGVFFSRLGLGQAMDPAWTKQAKGELIVSSDRARSELGWQPACSTAAEVIRKYVAEVPQKLDPRLRKFFRALNFAAKLQTPAPNQKLVNTQVHLALNGTNGGDLGLFMHQGKLSIRQTIPRPPASVVRLHADTLIELLAGHGDFAAAQLTGKVKVEGEP
ncbi:MAG: NAD-dependent epimerase/dehydratase family protein, partial [Calditrichaeota bacterium]